MAAIETSKEAVWLHKFLSALEVIPGMDMPITLYCDTKIAISNIKDSRCHVMSKHIDRRYHIIGGFVEISDVVIKVTWVDNLINPPLLRLWWQGALIGKSKVW